MISPSVQCDDEWIKLNSKCYKRLQTKLDYPSSKQVFNFMLIMYHQNSVRKISL